MLAHVQEAEAGLRSARAPLRARRAVGGQGHAPQRTSAHSSKPLALPRLRGSPPERGNFTMKRVQQMPWCSSLDL